MTLARIKTVKLVLQCRLFFFFWFKKRVSQRILFFFFLNIAVKVPVRRKEEKKKDNNNQPFCVNCAHAAFLLEEINRQRSHSELSLFISLLSFFSFFPCFSLFIFFFLFSVSPEQQRKQCTSHFRKRSIKQNDLMPVGAVGAGHAVHRLRSQLHLFSAVPPRVWPCGAQDNLHRVLLVRGYKPSHRR